MSSQTTGNKNCEVCGQQFGTDDELHQHKTQVHAGQNPNNQPTG
ncbi:MAG TPA: hypothetical protein VLG09_01890 [Candidatus Saccharimonadales bacterium]|nr:hypothetical protein [Candidatus Saccharimonadales bacterium]